VLRFIALFMLSWLAARLGRRSSANGAGTGEDGSPSRRRSRLPTLAAETLAREYGEPG